MPDKKDHRLKISVVEEKKEETQEYVEEKEKVSVPNEDKSKSESKEDTQPKQEDKEPEKKEETKDTLEEQIAKEEKQSIPFWVLFLAFLLGLALGAGIVGGLFFYKSKMIDSKTTPTPTSTPKPISPLNEETPVSSPSASPAALKSIKVEILNGTGVKGAAAKVEALIEAAGFENISVGNASTFNFTKTVLQAKTTVDKGVVDAVKAALSEVYVLEEKDPAKTQTSDIVITVGKTTK